MKTVTKVVASIVTGLAGSAAWMIAEPGAQSMWSSMLKPFTGKAEAEAAAAAEAEKSATQAAVVGLKNSYSATTSLTASMDGLIEIARVARRPDTAIVALTAANTKLIELNTRIATLDVNDTVALDLLKQSISDVTLNAVRVEVAGLAAEAEKIGGAVRSDLAAAEKELKKLDAASADAKLKVEEAMGLVATAVAAAEGSDAQAAVAAASNAEQAMVTLASLRSAGSTAFTQAKRQTFDTNHAASRTVSQEIVALSAGRKANVLANKDKKLDAKYLADTSAWAVTRVKELDTLAAANPTADRKTLTANAALAAQTKKELDAALVEVKIVSPRVPLGK